MLQSTVYKEKNTEIHKMGDTSENPIYSSFFGVMGASAAIIFSCESILSVFVTPALPFICCVYCAKNIYIFCGLQSRFPCALIASYFVACIIIINLHL